MLRRAGRASRSACTLTPLASGVAAAIAGEDAELIGPLMEGLDSDLLPRDDARRELLGVRLHRFDAAVERALRDVGARRAARRALTRSRRCRMVTEVVADDRDRRPAAARCGTSSWTPTRLADWVTIHRRLGSTTTGRLRAGFEIEQTLALRGAPFRVKWTLVAVPSRPAAPPGTGGPGAARAPRPSTGWPTATTAARTSTTATSSGPRRLARRASPAARSSAGISQREAHALAGAAQGAASRRRVNRFAVTCCQTLNVHVPFMHEHRTIRFC